MTHVNEMTKPDLIDLAVEQNLVKNKTAGKKLGIGELRDLLKQHHAGQIDAAIEAAKVEKHEPPHVADISEADEQRDFALREDGAGYVVKRDALPEVLREPLPDTAPGLRILDTQHEEPKRYPHAAKNSGEVYSARLRRLARNRRKNKKRIGRERHNAVNLQAGW